MDVQEVKARISATEKRIAGLLEDLQNDIGEGLDMVAVETWRYHAIEWKPRATVKITVKLYGAGD